jgi:hypothetical protein
LREKFVIRNLESSDKGDDEPLIALSNRIKFQLTTRDEKHIETYVVRAQNMHTTARLTAQMCRDFYDHGPLIERTRPFDFSGAYKSIIKGYEADWNDEKWVAVYYKGRVVFEAGEGHRHPFLDVIEKCDTLNKQEYAHTIEIAKDAFKQAGKNVSIDHDANVALIMKIDEEEGKCGVILRGPNKTTTFNFTAHPKAGRAVRASHCLTASAAFLEGIQLAFLIGMTAQKVQYGLIETATPENRKAEAASKKLGRLNNAVDQFENLLHVTYRPERPNFSAMVSEAEEFARTVLSKEIEAKIARGELEKDDWVL